MDFFKVSHRPSKKVNLIQKEAVEAVALRKSLDRLEKIGSFFKCINRNIKRILLGSGKLLQKNSLACTARADNSSQMPPLFATQNFEQGAVFVHSAGLANSEFMQLKQMIVIGHFWLNI